MHCNEESGLVLPKLLHELIENTRLSSFTSSQQHPQTKTLETMSTSAAFLPSFLALSNSRNAISTPLVSPSNFGFPLVLHRCRTQLMMTASPSTNQKTHETSSTDPSFTWTDQWYPVAWTEDVPDLKPISFML